MTMTKKSTQLFWHWISDWWVIFWLNVSPLSFPDGYSSCRWAGRSTSLWFCLSLWSARRSKYIRFQRKVFGGFLFVVVVLLDLFKPWEILTHEWELSWFKDSILVSTPCIPCRYLVVTSNTGPILVFPRIQPFGSDDFSSLGKVYSRQATDSVNCENSSVSLSWSTVRHQP